MTRIIRIPEGGRVPDDLARQVAEGVKACKVVAFPTDTVYGLGSTGLVKAAGRRLFEIKGRDAEKPLPILLASAKAADQWVAWTPAGRALARRFWPGALTLVLKPTDAGKVLTFAQYPTVAVRVPAHPVLRRLIEESGVPWASTSANASGSPALNDGRQVVEQFDGLVDFIVDAGKVPGAESSVVDASGERPRILRQGAISEAEILKALDQQASGASGLRRKVLFVCTGNSCRSVMAERLLAALAKDRSLALDARSCGTAAERYFEVPPHVFAVLGAQGIGRFEHIPQLVDRELLRWADLVLTMTDEHASLVLDRYPEFSDKVHVLGRYVDLSEPEIDDPIGQTEAVYAACRDKLRLALQALLERLFP